MNGLDVRVSCEPSLAQLPPHPTLLHPTKRNPPITIIARINPDHTSLNLLRHAMGLDEILSKNGAAKPIRRVVRTPDCFLLGVKARDDYKRTKDFFSIHPHIVCDVG